MATDPQPPPETVTLTVKLNLSGRPVEAELAVPTRPIPLRGLLPSLRVLAGAFLDRAVEAEAAQGRAVSCRSGCGACCRQLVPVTEVEARLLRDLVEDLPEPRRSTVRARFAEARRRLEESGVGRRLLDREPAPDDELVPIGLEYFRLGIACPFLEDESCSIYEERPIACREYLVTSPAEHCAHPTAGTIQRVDLPAKVSPALGRVGTPEGAAVQWVPLILAPEWADGHPDDLGERPGPEWLRDFFRRLTGRDIPPPPPPAASAGGNA